MELSVSQLVERRLSDLLDKGEGPAPDVLFADSATVAAAVAEGHDLRLYHAVRDILPRRTTDSDGPPGGGSGATTWAADLVVYQDGTLPDGEPVRSIGHWNPADQLEIFQVLSGRVLMLSCVLDESGDGSHVSLQECEAGDLAVVPFGAWHLTYVLSGPAMVINIYSGPAGASHDMSGKYRSPRGPAEITATRSGAGYDLALSPWLRKACGDPVRVTSPAWLRAHLPASGLLSDLYASGSDADLGALLALAHASPGPDQGEAVGLWRSGQAQDQLWEALPLPDETADRGTALPSFP
jgi:hypothetical protein